jgi:lipoprotein-releasing system permease protein
LATNVPYFIAKRYLFSWKKRNAINLITAISIIGIGITTAALVILISAFNGIEQMIDRMYSEFDTDLTILPANTKTFNTAELDVIKLKNISEIESTSRTIDELVILKNGDRWVNAKLMGVDSSFLAMADMNKHLLHNRKITDYTSFIFPGAGLLEKLQIQLDQENNYEPIVFFAPKRKLTIRPGKNPFYTENATVSAIMNYNREVNMEVVVCSFDFASNLLQYENELSSILINLKENCNSEEVKEKIQQLVGPTFKVQSRYEKNELIFKTSQTEKIIVICILVFVFILAAFNLIGSLTMLFVEKKKNIVTLVSMGLTRKNIFSIFFFEGLLLSLIGLIIGLFLGYSVSLAQIYGSLIVLPGTLEAFPINLKLSDGLFIISLVGGLSIIFSFTTVVFLVRNNFSNGVFIAKS